MAPTCIEMVKLEMKANEMKDEQSTQTRHRRPESPVTGEARSPNCLIWKRSIWALRRGEVSRGRVTNFLQHNESRPQAEGCRGHAECAGTSRNSAMGSMTSEDKFITNGVGEEARESPRLMMNDPCQEML